MAEVTTPARTTDEPDVEEIHEPDIEEIREHLARAVAAEDAIDVNMNVDCALCRTCPSFTRPFAKISGSACVCDDMYCDACIFTYVSREAEAGRSAGCPSCGELFLTEHVQLIPFETRYNVLVKRRRQISRADE